MADGVAFPHVMIIELLRGGQTHFQPTRSGLRTWHHRARGHESMQFE